MLPSHSEVICLLFKNEILGRPGMHKNGTPGDNKMVTTLVPCCFSLLVMDIMEWFDLWCLDTTILVSWVSCNRIAGSSFLWCLSSGFAVFLARDHPWGYEKLGFFQAQLPNCSILKPNLVCSVMQEYWDLSYDPTLVPFSAGHLTHFEHALLLANVVQIGVPVMHVSLFILQPSILGKVASIIIIDELIGIWGEKICPPCSSSRLYVSQSFQDLRLNFILTFIRSWISSSKNLQVVKYVGPGDLYFNFWGSRLNICLHRNTRRPSYGSFFFSLFYEISK